ncbi:sortase [Amycolatopsis acidicola]|uniref:Sortase n=1 Tax=Amycolatopsis acidicola TaxID=2596893 RepID=A0A5N0VBF2_9PSEU|nr:class F sortase [Amycolatopsis acidicola]KAA9162281.1 sortase [Amycolatopsis acidicola]
MESRHGRFATPFLLGVASLLLPGLLIAAGLIRPPTTAIAGSPQPVQAAVASVNAGTTPAPVVPRPTQDAPTSSAPPTSTAPRTQTAQPPGTVRLADGSTARLVRQEVVGGVLPVPKNLDEAAWWGAELNAPRGASVLAGHVNWGGRTGPFASLWSARIGQEITVADADGKPVPYRISQLVTLHKDELPQRATELFGQTGSHRLVLVTCGGEWIGGAEGYDENRVAVADPV